MQITRKNTEEKSNLVLCGFMSSGKTTIGRPLAERLGYAFADTDQMLTSTFQMSIPEMFAAGGEAFFRDREHEIARIAAACTRTVISTGGGMMTCPRNAELLAETGTVIYIHQDFDTCYERLRRQPDRPLVQNHTREQLHALYNARIAHYKQHASFTLADFHSVEEAVEMIVQFWDAF